MQINAGIGTPTIADITFSPSDTASAQTSVGEYIDVGRKASERVNGLTAETGVELNDGERFVTHTTNIDFTGIKFPETGIYEYIVKEKPNAEHEAAGIMHDNQPSRILDVYVEDNNGTLKIQSYVLHTEESDVAIGEMMGPNDVSSQGAPLDDKTDGFTNEYKSKDLVFAKNVTGLFASRDKYFEYTVKVENIADDDEFVVSLADDGSEYTTDGNADAVSGTTVATRTSNRGQTNPTSVTGAQLKAGVKFYLQHGQSIAVCGLAPNAVYTVTEDAEDYLSTASAVTNYTDPTTGTIGTVAGSNKAVHTSYLNKSDGFSPTGVIIEYAGPLIAMTIAVILGVFYIAQRKNRTMQ